MKELFFPQDIIIIVLLVLPAELGAERKFMGYDRPRLVSAPVSLISGAP